MTAALATIAPATAWALDALRRRPANTSQPASVTARAVLLALAACSDEALNSPHGYDGIAAAHLARLVGLAPATVVRWLRSLEASGLATTHGRLWRVPEEAFNR